MKLANRIVGQKKVSSRKRKKVEYRHTEGGSRNTQAPFRLQDLYFKMCKFFTVLLLLASPPSVNSKEIPIPRMCAVCLEKDCANGVTRIYPAGSDTAVWVKENSPTGIQNCSMENLKPDAPCKMANGSLVQQANEMLQFDSINARGVRHTFNSQILSCADLNLPPSSTPSPVTKAPIHNTPTPAATNNSVPDIKGIVIGSVIGSVIGIVIGIGIGFGIGFLIWKLYNWRRGQDRGCRKGNNGVPPHDAVHRDENTMEKQPLNAEVPNGNVNGVH